MKKLCFLASCLVASLVLSASIRLSAQANYIPVDLGSVNVGSSITTTVNVTAFQTNNQIWTVTVSSVGNTTNEFTNAGGGTCIHGADGQPCTVKVTFTPQHGDTHYGAVILTDYYGGIIATQLISGTGNAPETSFSPGLEFSLGTFANATGIALGSNGNVFVTTGSYGQGNTTQSGGVYTVAPNGLFTYGTPARDSRFTSPTVWTDQIGNAYASDPQYQSKYVVSLNTFPQLLKIAKPVSLAGLLDKTLFITKVGDTSLYNIYMDRPQTSNTPTLQSMQELGFAIGSNVWTDWFGNVFTLNNGQLSKYIRQLNSGYVSVSVLQSLSSNVNIDGYGNIYGSINGGTGLYKETLQPNGAYVLSSEIPVGIANPGHLTIDDLGNLFYDKQVTPATGDAPEYRSVIKEDFSQTPALTFATTAQGATSSDSGRVVTITNHGNLPLQFSDVIYPVDFPEAAGATGDCHSGTSLLALESCTITINFSPVTPFNGSNPATLSEVVKIVTNTLNNPSTEQDLAVSGIESSVLAATPAFSVAPGIYNNTVNVAITDVTPGATIYYTLNGTTPTKASAKYTGPVAIRNSYTLKAVAFASGAGSSNVGSANYQLAVATPVISLASGTYTGPQTVTITSASAGAKFIYTTNGTTPNANSPKYTGPITISATQTLKVLASQTGYTSSPIVANTYYIQLPPATPQFSVPSGVYNNTQYVSITDSVPGTILYYTLNGTTPTTASLKYTGPVAIRNSYTLNAIATAPGYSTVAQASASYQLTAATPVVSLASGTYSGPQSVTITTASTAARLHYTTNGSVPNANSPTYTSPITIGNSQTLKVIAIATGYTNSPVVSNAYTIQ